MYKRGLLLAVIVFLLMGCTLVTEEPDSPRIATATPTAPASLTPDDGWQVIAPGFDYQVQEVQPTDAPAFNMHILRIDPAQAVFRVVYTPTEARNSGEWRQALPDALAFINASFFTPEYYAIGLTVVDGQSYGYSLQGFGGMFSVDFNGQPRLQALVQEPYSGNQAYEQALQSFPMLVEPGGRAAPTGEGFDQVSRRTVIAQDTQGRILWLSTGNFGEINFFDLQDWLMTSDLEINAALNLDGGRSSMMYIRPPETSIIEVLNFSSVPAVLAVYQR